MGLLSIGELRCTVPVTLGLLIAVSGCSSTHRSRDGDAGAAGAAPQGAGVSGAAGTRSAGAGAAGASGTNASVQADAGAAGQAGSSARECRNHEDCDPFGAITCYMPGTSAADICGQPGWCGRCACPPQMEVPRGWGSPCATGREWDRPCEHGTVCDDGYCQGCATDADCGGDTPRCASYEPRADVIPVQRCAECVTASDCRPDAPVCGGEFDSYHPGRCIECSVSAPCAIGVCVDERCVRGCSSDADCANWQTCSPEQRCVVRSCTDDADCPLHYVCTERGCAPRNCKNDAGCTDGGLCVVGICHSTPGTCIAPTPPMQP